MRKRLKHLLPLLLCLHLQGCVWTVYNWREIPGPDTIDQYQSKAEKLEHYQKYAIQDLKFKDSWRMAYQMGFSTVAQTQTYYDLNSYTPIIYQLPPETEVYFAEAQNLFFQQEAQYEKIKETYNAALRKQLQLEEADLGALPRPSLALSWESPNPETGLRKTE